MHMNYIRDFQNHWRNWEMSRNNYSSTKKTYKSVTWTKSVTTGPIGTVVREEVYIDEDGKKDSYYDEYRVEKDGTKVMIKNDGNDKLKSIVFNEVESTEESST